MYREFETLYRRADRTRDTESTSGVFGEGSFLQGRRLVDRGVIERVVADRETYRPSEDLVNQARFEFGSGSTNSADLLRSLGLRPTKAALDRPKREELLTLGMARQLGVSVDGLDIDTVARQVAGGQSLTPRQQERLQMLRGRVHATAAAAGFDVQAQIGADITGLTNYGQMGMDALNQQSQTTIERIAGTRSIDERERGAVLGLVFGGLGGMFYGARAGNAEERALRDFLGEESNVNKLIAIQEELGDSPTDDRIKQVLGSHGLVEGATGRALFNYAQGGFNELENLTAINATRHYRRVIEPIARGIGRQARTAFADSTDAFGVAARAKLGAFGSENASPEERTAYMRQLMHRGLEDDDSLLGEARRLREAGLNDVARLFNTVEVLRGGNSADIQRAGLERFENLSGRPRREIIQGLGEAGMFTGAAGAQAQAAAGRGGGLEGRSLAGDLLAFSQRVDDLAGVVRDLQDRAGLAPSETVSAQDPDAPNDGQQQFEP
jgi:hypothetical protein